ncbi:T9SS type A sorting domain-containing protein, partial [bacterium]|nr:T9SS type A sorting domain-containing protein [bacterium]
ETFDCVMHRGEILGIDDGGYPIKPEDIKINVYPNPFNAIVNIEIALVRAIGQSPLQIEIFDIEGRLVKQYSDRMEGWMDGPGSSVFRLTGSPSYIWYPENLPSGIYFIKVYNQNRSFSKKVVYLK